MSTATPAVARVVCAPWCTEGDGHPEAACRADQSCQGPQPKVVLGLEDGAPPLPLQTSPFGAPGITVYAYKEWHELPHVRLNVFREHENQHLSVDTDLDLTSDEARELARNLMDAADQADRTTR